MDLFNRKVITHRELEIEDLQSRLTLALATVEKVKETCERRIREVDHDLGLERKRHEMEVEEAIRNTHWEASQKLEREKDRHMEALLNTINLHHKEIIQRLPTVHVDKQIKQGNP